jgi:hypothetical protein
MSGVQKAAVGADHLRIGHRRLPEVTLYGQDGKVKQMSARRYRDALTGRFVTKKYAKKHRKTTVKESAAPGRS